MKRSLLALVATLCLGASIGFFAPQASAQGSCDTTVIDGAHVFGDSFSDVEQKAKEIGKDIGATVYVRTVKSVGSAGTLDNLNAKTVNDCQSWQDVNSPGLDKNGNRFPKVNLLTFWMGLDHTVGIFYGHNFVDKFKDYGGEQQIYSQQMGPMFAAGDFARGFTDGMTEAKEALRHKNNTGSGGNTTIVNEKPTNLNGLWLVLGIIVGALIVFGGGYLLYQYFADKRKAEEARRTMRQRALTARDAASTIRQNLDTQEANDVRLAKVTKYSKVGGDKASILTAARQTVTNELNSAADKMAAAASANANEDDADLTTGEYQLMAERYEDALADAQNAQAADTRITDTCEEIDAALAQVSTDIASTQAGLVTLKESADTLAAGKIKVGSIVTHYEASANALGQAQANSTDLSALEYLAAAQSELDAGNDALSTLNDRRQQIAQGIPALAARVADVKQRTVEVKKVFERIAATYAPSSWEAVKGNGSEAEDRIVAAEADITKATEQSNLDNQSWEDAIVTMQDGNQLCDEVDGLLKSITELEGHLETAKATASQEIEDAASDIAKAQGYLQSYSGDIEVRHTDDLARAQELLEQAKQELNKPLPDYLQVVKLATSANSAADSIYDDFVSQEEAAERLRRQAASALQQAAQSISQAREFIDDHSSDVDSSPEGDLSQAQQYLAQAQGLNDPKEVLQYAQSAIDSADSAYQRAKRQFDDAEEERARERRRREEAARAAREAAEEAAAAARRASESYSHSSYSSSSSSSSIDFGGGSSGGWGGGGSSGGGSSGSW